MTTTPLLHVDMDAFYASVLLRDRPDLRRPAVHRRRRPPQRGARGELPGAGVRRPVGHDRRRGPAAVPAGGLARARLRRVHHGVPLGDGGLPPGDAGGGGDLVRRGVPRRARVGAPARATRRGSPTGCGPRCTTSRASPARSAWRRRCRWPSSPAAGPSRTASSWCHPRRWWPSCTGSTSATSSASVRRPRRCCASAASTRWPTSRTPRSPTCRRRSAGQLGAQLHHLAWGTDRDELAPDNPGRLRLRRPHRHHGAAPLDGRPGDLRPRHRRPRRRAPRGAAAHRPGRGPAAQGRPRRSHRHAHRAVLRLHHDHPLAHAGRGHRRHPGDLRRGGPPLRRARAPPGAGPAASGCGSRTCCRGPGCTVRGCSASPTTAGPTPTAPSTGRCCGSARPPSGRRASSGEPFPVQIPPSRLPCHRSPA